MPILIIVLALLVLALAAYARGADSRLHGRQPYQAL